MLNKEFYRNELSKIPSPRHCSFIKDENSHASGLAKIELKFLFHKYINL